MNPPVALHPAAAPRRAAGRRRGGFSLLEVLVVLVIIGIMTAIVAPALGSLDAQRRDAAVEEVARSLRYARATAMATGAPTGVRFRTAPSVLIDLVRLDPDTLSLDAVPGPLGQDLPTVYLSAAFRTTQVSSITNGDGTTSADETVWFSFDGTPHTRAANGSAPAAFTEDFSIELLDGADTRTITVREHSGLVDVS